MAAPEATAPASRGVYGLVPTTLPVEAASPGADDAAADGAAADDAAGACRRRAPARRPAADRTSAATRPTTTAGRPRQSARGRGCPEGWIAASSPGTCSPVAR